ncbi:MerR family transcriptional regulator [Corynebacterium suedekumii]|uniref:MerR family transcriptional regulator n=1 Tax=Corynebacterium suedekumii TaxID=3049801 RepID=A0ABY8VQX1_9CORY|nr:MerR family transcriptional regulator [Corynebacterium suedekumii]WIM70593.1 MerR family transcriptional regulator [Corynebacterium suedekumii]
MEWTVQELADRAGVSGRTLRHYHQIELLTPDRIGSNGYRYYGPTAVALLQRILLLREAGLSLAAIGEALGSDANPADEIAALEEHLAHLEHERDALERRDRLGRTHAPDATRRPTAADGHDARRLQ